MADQAVRTIQIKECARNSGDQRNIESSFQMLLKRTAFAKKVIRIMFVLPTPNVRSGIFVMALVKPIRESIEYWSISVVSL